MLPVSLKFVVTPERLERSGQAFTFSKGKTRMHLQNIHHPVRIQTNTEEVLIFLCNLTIWTVTNQWTAKSDIIWIVVGFWAAAIQIICSQGSCITSIPSFSPAGISWSEAWALHCTAQMPLTLFLTCTLQLYTNSQIAYKSDLELFC